MEHRHIAEQVIGCAYAVYNFVEDKVIVELKSVRRVVKAHEVQLVNYLTATSIDVGLLLNFAEQKVEVKRKSRTLPEKVDF